MGLAQAPNSQRQSVDAILGLVRDALPCLEECRM